MTPVAVIALQEVKNGLRNRWVLAATLLLAVLALSLTLLGSAPTGAVKVSELTVTVVSLASLTVFLVPLIALLLAYDAIVGEAERGTLLLLLAYPVARHQVLLGKFLGHLFILVVATVLGYGAAGLAVGLRGETGPAAWAAFGALLGSSILLGATFLAIGYLLSALVRERATAGGMALGIWLLLVIVYDTALLGLLVADDGHVVTPGLFGALLCSIRRTPFACSTSPASLMPAWWPGSPGSTPAPPATPRRRSALWRPGCWCRSGWPPGCSPGERYDAARPACPFCARRLRRRGAGGRPAAARAWPHAMSATIAAWFWSSIRARRRRSF